MKYQTWEDFIPIFPRYIYHSLYHIIVCLPLHSYVQIVSFGLPLFTDFLLFFLPILPSIITPIRHVIRLCFLSILIPLFY